MKTKDAGDPIIGVNAKTEIRAYWYYVKVTEPSQSGLYGWYELWYPVPRGSR